MVFALGVVVYAFAFSVPLRPGVRLLLLLMSPVVALVCNVIRLIPTAALFGYATTESAQLFHELSGWVMLFVALLLLVSMLRLVRWLELPIFPFRLAAQ